MIEAVEKTGNEFCDCVLGSVKGVVGETDSPPTPQDVVEAMGSLLFYLKYSVFGNKKESEETKRFIVKAVFYGISDVLAKESIDAIVSGPIEKTDKTDNEGVENE